MQPNQESHQQQILTIPMAIVLAAVIIGGVLLYMYRPATTAQPNANSQVAPSATVPDTSSLPPVTAADHILGNPNAPIKIVEYSDPSCPYCKMFQTTMLQVMQTYGAGGQVAWVYRSFPLDKPDANGNILHPNSGAQANAFECAASIGGNAGFWAYEKDWYVTFPDNGANETADVNNQQLVSVAKDTGINAIAFNNCLSSNKFAGVVEKQYQGGLALGINGTPTNIILLSKPAPLSMDDVISNLIIQLRVSIQISNDRNMLILSGALPESAFKAIIDAIPADQRQNTATTTSGQ
jgi:protein-disulfide isomerase